MELWILPFIGYLTSSVSSALLYRTYAQKSQLNPLVSSLVRNTIVGIPMMLLISALSGGVNLLGGWNLAFAALLATINVGYNQLSFYAVKYSDAATFATIIKTHVLIVIFGGALFFGESLTGAQYFGAGLMILSSMIIGRLQVGCKSILILMSACALLGLLVLGERYLVLRVDVTTVFFTSLCINYLYRAALSYKILVGSRLAIKKELPAMIRLSVVAAPGPYLLTLATDMSGNIALTSALGVTKVLFVSFGAAMFLHERNNLKRKIVAALITVIGALFI